MALVASLSREWPSTNDSVIFHFSSFFLCFLCYIVHFLHTQPCHCLDGYRLALNWANTKKNSSNIENEVEANEQLRLLHFLIPETKTADNETQILLMAKSKCHPLKTPFVGTICSAWPELWRLQSYGIVHANIAHLMNNLLAFLFYGLYFEYRHGALLTSLLIFVANFAAMPIASSGNIYGASSGCFALLGAICVDMVVILNKTLYRFAWKLKARQIFCCFTLLLSLLQLLFLAFTLFYSITHFAKIRGVQNLPEQAHLAGFVTGLLFGILINCSNETKQRGQKPMIPNCFRIICKISMAIWLAFIVGSNLLFLYRAFEIERNVPLSNFGDAKELFEMVQDDYIMALNLNPDLKFNLTVHLCRAYNNEKYWRDDVKMPRENSTQYLAEEGVKRPAFCRPLAFIFASLQIILTVFSILFWEKFRMINKANVADTIANSEANAVVIGENGGNNTNTKDAKERQEEEVSAL